MVRKSLPIRALLQQFPDLLLLLCLPPQMARDLETPILAQINRQLNTAEKRSQAVTAIIGRMPTTVDNMLFLLRAVRQGDRILALRTTDNENK